jgi:NADH dehydrogenase FAD-containing subunit
MAEYPRRKLVIAGGGHASLPLIKMGHHWKKKNLSITLVSAEPYLIYSGALPQFMGGFYDWSRTAIDLGQLCNRYGVNFIRSNIASADHINKFITMDDGSCEDFDLLLINVGASTSKQPEDGHSYPVKPMSKLLHLKKKIESGEVKNILIQGGGAAGTEIALNLTHPRSKNRCTVTITELNNRLLSNFPIRASDIATGILKKRGVNILTGVNTLPDRTSGYDAIILATGNKPESMNMEHKLPTGNGKRILTDSTLIVKGTTNVFAAGDTADINGTALPQIGVHAVKQGVTLRKNIEALLDGKPLHSFKPYPVNPLILSNGPDDAIFTAKQLCISGKSPAVLKYVLDMNWLEKYTLPADQRRGYIELIRDGYSRLR